MKKNLISVIILALCLANFVLTALLMFTVLPETKKANELITAVCSAIALDLNSGQATGVSNVKPENREEWALNSGEDITITLADDGSGKTHYAVIKMSFVMNNQSEGYTTYGSATLTAHDGTIKSEVNSIISKYTMDEYNELYSTEISDKILEYMQDTYGSDFIIGVNFSESLAS